MKAVSTSDISLELLRETAAALGDEFQLEVDERQFFFKSLEAPSWIGFVADPVFWVRVFGAAAALYIGEIIRAAGKDTWRNRDAIIRAAARVAGSALTAFSNTVIRLRGKLDSRTAVEIGFPFPDAPFGTRLRLEGVDEHVILAQLALFAHHVPALEELLRSEVSTSGGAIGSVLLELRDDGALEVRWVDRQEHKEQRRIIPLDAA